MFFVKPLRHTMITVVACSMLQDSNVGSTLIKSSSEFKHFQVAKNTLMDHGQQQITARVAFYFHYRRLPLKYYCTYLGGEKQQFLSSQSCS